MDWDHLRFFVAVARAGNLSKAADSLRVNHSTVFRRLKAFEDELGVRLFERLPEGYALTAAGEIVLEHADRVDEAIVALARSVAGRDFQLGGDIRLTTPANLATEYVAPLLERFRAEYPAIRVEIAVSDSDYDLARRQADLALRATSAPPDYLVGRRVASVPWFVYAGKRYRRDLPTRIEDLTDHPLVGGDESLRRLPALQWLHGRFPREQFSATANELNTIAAVIASGIGLGVLPADQNKPDIKSLFPVQPRFTSDLWLLTHPDLRHVARVKAFSDFLFESLRADARLADVR